jgi:Mg-chelatase subunit ChlD
MSPPVSSRSALWHSAFRLAALTAATLIASLTLTITTAGPAVETNTFVSADTEGHLTPCDECPAHQGFGGLARRATLISDARKTKPDLLLLDAGNFLFGGEGADDDGRGAAAIVAAYDAMGYTAVNPGYRDFRYGAARTRDLLKNARFTVISCNLLDAESGRPLFSPYVVRPSGGRRIAIVGVTQIPSGLESLPHLRQQLAGIRITPPMEALAQWLPKAAAEADAVVLLYYGSASELRAITAKFGDQILAIGAGGIRRGHAFPAAGPPVVLVEEHGKSLGHLSTQHGEAEEVLVAPTLAEDPAMIKLLAQYGSRVARGASEPSTQAVKPSVTSTARIETARATTAVAPAATAPAVAMTARTPQSQPAVAMPVTPTTAAASASSPPVRRVAAQQPRTPLGLPGVGLSSDQVNAAIDKGRDFLWQHVRAEHDKHHATKLITDGPDLLSSLALVHAGAPAKIPEFEAQLRQYLSEAEPRAMQLPTYEAGLFCLLIEAYGDPVYLPKLRDTAQYLIELQGPMGSWNYGTTVPQSAFGTQRGGTALAVFGGTPLDGPKPGVEQLARVTDYVKERDGDNSVSQFALLGLHAASRWRLAAPAEAWKRNLAIYRARQCPDGGWDYDKLSPSGYGSMTCAGICGIAINRYELGERDPAADEAIERGLGWLEKNFTVSGNPAHGTSYLYYYLYSLERVGRILDTEFIGAYEWYPLGAKFLVEHQKPSGKWVESNEEEDARLATSFALLFLTRATETLNTNLARNGSGELRTSLASAPPSRLYLILDASGSMLDEMGGRVKFDLARDAVRAMVSLLRPRAQVALRVYGHRKRSIEPGADEDTQLLIPMAEYDPRRFESSLASLRSRGKTPLALSLEQATQDLQNAGGGGDPTTVVLLTDGGEDTMPRRDPVRAAAQFGQLKGITFHIVGFDVNQEDWNAQLRQMADKAGGQYWPAPRGEDLTRSLRALLLGDPDFFVVLDPTGREIYRGRFAERKRLPEGKYTLVTQYAGREFRQDFWINTGGSTAVTFDASRVPTDTTARPISAPIAASPTTAPAAANADTTPKFCTHCGAKLKPGAKFCTECGTPVAK